MLYGTDSTGLIKAFNSLLLSGFAKLIIVFSLSNWGGGQYLSSATLQIDQLIQIVFCCNLAWQHYLLMSSDIAIVVDTSR